MVRGSPRRPKVQARNRIVVRARRHRALDVLRLSAPPVRSDDQAPCHPVRRLSPEPGAHQMQAGVHGGGGASRGQDVTVVDGQHRLVVLASAAEAEFLGFTTEVLSDATDAINLANDARFADEKPCKQHSSHCCTRTGQR